MIQMNSISIDQGLLIIALIVASVSLFISLFNAIILIDISKKMNALKNLGFPHVRNDRSSVQKDPAVSEEVKKVTQYTLQHDNDSIGTGIQSVVERYPIDSIVVAMKDGLVVTSVGRKNPEFDAAYFSSLFNGEYTHYDEETVLIPLEHQGVPLIGIVRTKNVIPQEMLFSFAKEVQTVFEQNL